MFALFLLLALVVACHAGHKEDAMLQAWPTSFFTKFYSNITTDQFMTPDLSSYPISAKMYYRYDENVKAQKVEHDAGTIECAKFYNSEQPCTLYFLPEGLYRVLQTPLPKDTTQTCCLDMEGLGPTPPDFMFKSAITFDGMIRDYSNNNLLGEQFSFDSDNGNPHRYVQVSPTHPVYGKQPLIFTFPAANGLQDYHFIVESMDTSRAIEESVFELPQGCRYQKCIVPPESKQNKKE